MLHHLGVRQLSYLALQDEEAEDSQLLFFKRGLSLTWNVVALTFDVHFMQASLCGLVLDCNGAILIVSDMWAGSLA